MCQIWSVIENHMYHLLRLLSTVAFVPRLRADCKRGSYHTKMTCPPSLSCEMRKRFSILGVCGPGTATQVWSGVAVAKDETLLPGLTFILSCPSPSVLVYTSVFANPAFAYLDCTQHRTEWTTSRCTTASMAPLPR